MSDLTLEGLAELWALEAAATPAPWTNERHDQDNGSISYELWAHWAPGEVDRITVLNDRDDGKKARLDAKLIAALRNAAPALIRMAEENGRLAQDNSELHAFLGESGAIITHLRARLAKAERVVEAARTEHKFFIGVPSRGCELCNALASYSAKETQG